MTYPDFYLRSRALLAGLFATRWGQLIIAAVALGILALIVPVLLRFGYFLLLAAFGLVLIVVAVKVLSFFLRP